MCRCIYRILCPLVAGGLLVALATLVPTPVAQADVAVHGVIPGTQHSPSVAVTPTHMYVLSVHRDTSLTAIDQLKLAGSMDDAVTFQGQPLPTLPANWYWRPDASLAYDPAMNQVWMVGQAHSFNVGPGIGVYVSTGVPQLDGSVAWLPPRQLWSMAGGTSLPPNLALATGDGSGAAFVLFLNGHEGPSDTVKLYRVPKHLGTVDTQDLAANELAVGSYTTPALAVGPGGDVLAGWLEVPAVEPIEPAPYVTRTSHDGGTTFGPEEVLTSMRVVADGPGESLRSIQLPTLLFAKHSLVSPHARLAFWATPSMIGKTFDPSGIWSASDCCDTTGWNPGTSTMLDRLPGSYELNPAVVMAEDGYVYMGWHDFQPYDPENRSRFMVTRLWNMGLDAAPPVELAAATFDWDDLDTDQDGMGWSSAAGESEGRVLFAWTDHRSGSPDILAGILVAPGVRINDGCDDTVFVTAGQGAKLRFRLENRNSHFRDRFEYQATPQRAWPNQPPPNAIELYPGQSAEVSYTISVPDTAAPGLQSLLFQVHNHGGYTPCDVYLRVLPPPVGVPPGEGTTRSLISLATPRPNPSAGTTLIGFSLATTGAVELAVHDLRGTRVATLVQGERGAGEHTARWDCSREAAGVYFVRLTARTDAGVTTRERRLIVLR